MVRRVGTRRRRRRQAAQATPRMRAGPRERVEADASTGTRAARVRRRFGFDVVGGAAEFAVLRLQLAVSRAKDKTNLQLIMV